MVEAAVRNILDAAEARDVETLKSAVENAHRDIDRLAVDRLYQLSDGLAIEVSRLTRHFEAMRDEVQHEAIR